METKRTRVFISYSHRDRNWLERLRVHLKPLEREFEIAVWDDTRIRPGSKWREEIREAIKSSKVAVLLISADFLASDFIATDELPPLLAAAEEDGAIILPVIVSPSRFLRIRGLSQFQTVNEPSKPLISMTRGEQEAVFVSVSESIEAALTPPRHPEVYSAARGFTKERPPEKDVEGERAAEAKRPRLSILNRLEKTVSNPNYRSDLKTLEDRWDITQIIGPETIIIVTGSHTVCELLDRPVAEIIRDEIDRQGDISAGQRGIIVGDLGWFKDAELQSHHVISLGGPSINPLTKEITSLGETSSYSPGVFKAVFNGEFVRVALWGDKAAQTRASAEFYIQHPEGLSHLLDVSWNR